ncbi:MAG TPA: aminoacyl-tRNA hydrolase [Pseudomonadales bacterium]|nr:aminoacyl-tRNA hydrolase [Pseudomonadales bacterium]
MPIKLIVGLGNPGPEYEQTRHNAGAWLLKRLFQQQGLTPSFEKKFHGSSAKTRIAGQDLFCLLPTTYMNLSGQSVSTVCQFYKIQPEEILIAHDELDIDAGKARLKLGGGHGGHNGLRNIITELSSSNFYRLRLGIGHPGSKEQVVNYVLGKPSADDRQRIDSAIDDCLKYMEQIIKGEISAVMNALHK